MALEKIYLLKLWGGCALGAPPESITVKDISNSVKIQRQE